MICAGTGSSLPALVNYCRGVPVIAISDAYQLLPHADVLYSCDAKWWDVHDGAPSFHGECWSSHSIDTNDKRDAARRHGLRLVAGTRGSTFAVDGTIRYGSNSGFQAINLAIAFGATRVLLAGYDMRGPHFFGAHPRPLVNTCPSMFIAEFDRAAAELPAGICVINCTPGSALRCFPFSTLAAELS